MLRYMRMYIRGKWDVLAVFWSCWCKLYLDLISSWASEKWESFSLFLLSMYSLAQITSRTNPPLSISSVNPHAWNMQLNLGANFGKLYAEGETHHLAPSNMLDFSILKCERCLHGKEILIKGKCECCTNVHVCSSPAHSLLPAVWAGWSAAALCCSGVEERRRARAGVTEVCSISVW